jgi:hypothetical protein
MSLRFFFPIFLIVLGIYTSMVYAGQVQERELKELDEVQTRLDLQREWIQYRYDASVKSCYALFWVQRCLDKARAQSIKDRKVVRDQELDLHDRKRLVNELQKDEKDQIRVAEYQDPKKVQERANNRAAYEEKQRLRAERAVELEERKKDAEKRSQENKQTLHLD